MSVAIPKRDIKPTISVIVVKITPPARAGSIFNLDNIKGKLTPLTAPIIKLIINADAITVPKKKLSNHRYTARATTVDHKIPLSIPIEDSLIISNLEFDDPIWSSA